jgi:mRNA interferase RelE/StbE
VTARRSGRHPDADRVVVRLIEPAFDDLRALLRLDPQIVRWAVKKMLLLERNPHAGAELHGMLIGWRKLTVSKRVGAGRGGGRGIIWRVTSDGSGTVIVDVAEVWAVGARADSEVYEEMRSRVATLPSAPKTVALAEVIERLGKAAAGLSATPEPATSDPVPEWLINRLTHQVGLAPDTAARMSLQEAVDAWTEWTNRQR